MKRAIRIPYLYATLVSTGGLAKAAVTMTMSESGGDVTVTMVGSLDLAGATLVGSSAPYQLGLIPAKNTYIASGSGTSVDMYQISASAGDFGSSLRYRNASSSSGDNFMIWRSGSLGDIVGVPPGYVSGDFISSTMTLTGITIEEIGATPGTYAYRIPNDLITLTVVPEPSSVLLIGFGAFGLIAHRRRAFFR